MSTSHIASGSRSFMLLRWLPSPTALVFLATVAIASVFFSDSLVNRISDGDTARHIAHGRRVIANGGVLRSDPFSYTRPGAPMVDSEYGWGVITAVLYDHIGLVAIGALAILVLAATYAIQCHVLLSSGVPPSLAVPVVWLAAWMASAHWIARPHIVSLLGVAVVLWLYTSDRVRRPWWPILLFALWANIHPGWVYAGVLLGILTIGHLAEWVLSGRKADEEWQRALKTAWLAGCVAVGSLLNPYGIRMHLHVLEFMGLQYNIDTIGEWLSPNFHGWSQLPLMVGLLSIVFALGVSRRRVPMPILLVLIFQVYEALYATRHKSYLGLTGLTLLAIHLAPEWIVLRDRVTRGMEGLEQRWSETHERLWYAVGVAVLVMLVFTNGRFAGKEIIPRAFSEEQFPIQLIARTRARNLEGRMFTTMAWAGYMGLGWPEQKIFIDGGGDFYGDDLLRETIQLRDRSRGWTETMRKWDFRLMLLRRGAPLALDVGRLPGWYVLDCDRRAVLLARLDAPPAATPAECSTGLATTAKPRGTASQ